MTAGPRPTIVMVHFDAKRNGPPPVQPNAPDLIKYLTRLAELPDEIVHDARARVDYLMRGDALGAFAARNFHALSLAGLAYELAVDAKCARVRPALSHGTISLKRSPGESPVTPTEFLAVGHRAMELLGVDKNRYVLAVHVDTDHVHLHFLYSRVIEGGVRRERSRKYSKFMCEEACAVLAHEFGFDLEKRHLSRADGRGVRDLASEQYTRDAAFNEIVPGAEQRTRARRKIAAKSEEIQEVAKLALVARYLAQGDLGMFRALLADEGISYEKSGSGAKFVDAHGQTFKASEVDSRFSPEHIGLRGVMPNVLAEQPNWMAAQIERRRAELKPADDLIPDVNGAAEWARFQAAREKDEVGGQMPTEAKRIEQDVRRCFRKNGAGRPTKSPLPDHWPTDTRPVVAVASASRSKRRPQLPEETYRRTEQPSRTEFWRGDALVATVRYSTMTIYSKKPEDLQAALLAAHRAWGPVEVFGNKKFQKQIVELAAQLDVPLSNANLQAALERARDKLGKPLTPVVGSAQPFQETASSSVRSVTKSTGSAERAPSNASIQANADLLPPSDAQQSPVQVPAPIPPQDRGPAAPSFSTSKTDSLVIQQLLAEFDRVNRPVIRQIKPPHLFTLTQRDPAQILLTTVISHPEMQRGLEKIHFRQDLELNDLQSQIRAAECRIRATPATYANSLRIYQPVQMTGAVRDFFRRYQSHPRCAKILEQAWQEQEARDQRLAMQEPAPQRVALQNERARAVAQPTPHGPALEDVQRKPNTSEIEGAHSASIERLQNEGRVSAGEVSQTTRTNEAAPTVSPVQHVVLASKGAATETSNARREGAGTSQALDEGRSLAGTPPHNNAQTDPSPMVQRMALDLDEFSTLDQIERENRLLRDEEGHIVFAEPEGATEAQRLFLAAHPRIGRRLFNEQECATSESHQPVENGRSADRHDAGSLSRNPIEREKASNSAAQLDVSADKPHQIRVDPARARQQHRYRTAQEGQGW